MNANRMPSLQDAGMDSEKRNSGMVIQIGGRPDSGFDDPLGRPQDCHRRIERFLWLYAISSTSRLMVTWTSLPVPRCVVRHRQSVRGAFACHAAFIQRFVRLAVSWPS
jgi:hypothetical protein